MVLCPEPKSETQFQGFRLKRETTLKHDVYKTKKKAVLWGRKVAFIKAGFLRDLTD